MFDLEKYIKIKRTCLECDNDGTITGHIDIDIDDDEINKEVEELRENLFNIRKILGYNFVLTVDENKINFEELK